MLAARVFLAPPCLRKSYSSLHASSARFSSASAPGFSTLLSNANVPFITSNTVLIGFVGTLGLPFFANAIYNIKADHPRAYGLFVLGVACGFFSQAVIYLKNPCPDC